MSYHPVLIIPVGTAACGSGLLVEDRRRSEIARLRARERSEAGPADAPNEREAMETRRRLEYLTDNIRVIGIDVDGSGAYDLHPSLAGEPRAWRPGAFLRASLPGPDLRRQQLSGRLAGYEAVNPQALVGIDGLENAAGGVPNLGWLAIRTGERPVGDAIRGALNAFARLTRERFREGVRVRIRIVAGTFGGFGSGALAEVEELVLKIASEVFSTDSAWDLRTLLLLPGRHRGKDPDNSRAVSCGVLIERAARASGWMYRVSHDGRGPVLERRRPVPVTLMSDENVADSPSVLSVPDFTAAVAEFLWAEVATPAGELLLARGSDLDTAGAELTELGEPLQARSAGVSCIELPVDRIRRYCEARLASAVLSRLLMEVEEDQIDRMSRSLFMEEQLLEGDGYADLSRRLLQLGRAGLGVEALLTRRFRQSTEDLGGLALLVHAGDRMDLVVRQVDVGATLAGEAERTIAEVDARLAVDVRRLFRNPLSGAAAARQFLEATAARAGHLAQMAAADTVERDQRVQEAERGTRHFEDNFTPAVRNMNWFVRRVKRDQIESAADRYRRALEQRAIARARLISNQRAIRVLEGVRDAAERLQHDVSQAIDTLEGVRSTVEDEVRRVAGLPKGTTCPVGLSLVEDEGDLKAYYIRFLGDRGEPGAMSDVAARLLAERDPVALASDRSGVESLLSEYVATAFRAPLAELHVAEALEERFPDADEMSEVVRERAEREAVERVPLRDGTDHVYDPPRRVAVMGLDTARGASVRERLEERPEAESLPFEVADTGDRERVVFIRVRGALPLSAWSHLEGFRTSYETVSARSPYERPHVLPGDRFLPWPGRGLSELDASVIVLKAWLLGRLEIDPKSGRAILLRGDGELRLAADGRVRYEVVPERLERLDLGDGFSTLVEPHRNGRKAFGIAVDVTSLFNCAVQGFGIEPLETVLRELRGSADSEGDPSVPDVVAGLASDEALERIRAELDHWRQNTLPALLGFASEDGLLRGTLS